MNSERIKAIRILKSDGVNLEWKLYSTKHLQDLADEVENPDYKFEEDQPKSQGV